MHLIVVGHNLATKRNLKNSVHDATAEMCSALHQQYLHL